MNFLKDISPRKYQQEIFQSCIDKNCLVVLPTGLGKTLIALMLVIKRMELFPGQKAVFLAPTKPLAEQHLKYFKNHLPELFGQLELFTGAVNAASRKKIWQTADIIFSTPQCVANDVKNNLYDLNDVCILIEDEAHRCVKEYDYNYIARKYIEQSENPRILGLTASPGSDRKKINEICRNLSIEKIESRTRDSEDVKEYLQELTFEKIMVDFPPELREIRTVFLNLFNKYVAELKARKILFEFPSKTNLIKLQQRISINLSKGNKNFNYLLGASTCAQAIKIQHALELLETQTLLNFNKYLKNLFDEAAKKKSKGVVKLASSPEFNFAFIKSNELLDKNFEHPKLEKLEKIISEEKSKNEKIKVMIFTQFRETASIISGRLNKIDGIISKVFIGQAKGATGIQGLSQKEQGKIIEEFSEGKINVLCATSIGEEGLDIPEVNLVVFYETVPSAIRKIQRTGRTARLIEGKLIMLITKDTRDEVHFYVSRAKEKKMYSVMDEMKGDFEIKKEEKQKTLV